MKPSQVLYKQQLGMAVGSASSRLRKILFFNLVQRCGEDICYVCSERITSHEDLTIEHKKPWVGVSPDLFWDLDNIAYSHFRCNKPPHRSGSDQLRKIGPEGTSWCTTCKDFLPVSEFGKDSSRWNGLHYYCSSCRKEYDRKGYRKEQKHR